MIATVSPEIRQWFSVISITTSSTAFHPIGMTSMAYSRSCIQRFGPRIVPFRSSQMLPLTINSWISSREPCIDMGGMRVSLLHTSPLHFYAPQIKGRSVPTTSKTTRVSMRAHLSARRPNEVRLKSLFRSCLIAWTSSLFQRTSTRAFPLSLRSRLLEVHICDVNYLHYLPRFGLHYYSRIVHLYLLRRSFFIF